MGNTTHHMPLTKDSFYIQDMETALPPSRHLDAHEKSVLLDRVKVIRAELRDALGEAAVISIKRWLPGVTKKDDELDPTDAYHKSMFGGDYKPKTKKTPEYCRQSAFKQAHSMISVFERRNTLEDLARKSKASLHSMYSEDGGDNGGNGRGRTMSDADRRHKTLTELGNLQSLSNLLAATSPKGGNSDKFSFDDENDADKPIPKIIRQLSGHDVAASGAGNFGQTGAGGAGALPASSDIINIVNSHFTEESEDKANKKREASHMSYIYADEESQKSPKNKMVIKIYPPSLQAVASKSPSGANEQ